MPYNRSFISIQDMDLDEDIWRMEDVVKREDELIQPGDIDLLDFDEHEFAFETDATLQPAGEVEISSTYPGSDTDSAEEAMEENDPVPALESLVSTCLEGLLDALPAISSEKQLPRASSCIGIQLANRRVTPDESGATKMVCFPQNTKRGSSSAFAQVLRVVDLMHEALHDDVPITKRDMYYRDVALFNKQSVVDKHVDDIAATMGVCRGDLNVRASSKGLFCGPGLTIHLCSGETLLGNDSEGTLIPVADDIERFDMQEGLSWVLVVEKEAVFQTLLRVRFSTHPSLPGWGIIITGKGYPDVATRQLVCTLANNLPESVPILAVVDGDAFGLDIVSVYKNGSDSMAHERDILAAPRLQWAGIMGSELPKFGVDKDSLLPITKHDEKKAHSLLRRPNLLPPWRRELQHMLFSRRKAEIEVLANTRCSKDTARSGFVPESQTSTMSSPLEGAGMPLINYLVHKIAGAIEEYAEMH